MTRHTATLTDAGERRREVERLLDEVVDPCSVAAGTPIGLLAMGIVETVDVAEDAVTIRLLPTFPGCLYTGVFAGEVERQLGRLPWLRRVDVRIVTDGSIWDEDRMEPAARRRLERSRAERRRRLAEVRARS
jgi:metal-sulfur cluster biosynthetic enzyme